MVEMTKSQKKRARQKRNKKKKNLSNKITNQKLTLEFLDSRVTDKFGPAKWMQFARYFINEGYEVELYEARQTFSKYLTVIRGEHRFKVRFSNHKPILEREINGDCDYFVGRTNLRVSTTDTAIAATEIFFRKVRQNA